MKGSGPSLLAVLLLHMLFIGIVSTEGDSNGTPTSNRSSHAVDLSDTKNAPGLMKDGKKKGGEMVTYSASANFTPHVITVAAGEEITTKIISFSQQEPMAICILSANGSVSDVTLRQPHSSGGILTYEGLFELLSLSGSFMPNDRGGTKSRSRGMSVSVASPDGRVLGGGVAGLLVAASPVQVVVGSFLPSHQLEQKTIKSKLDSSVATPTVVIPMSTMDIEEANSSGKGQYHSSTPQSSSFGGENWSSTLHG